MSMSQDKCQEVVDRYDNLLSKGNLNPRLRHVSLMLPSMRQFLVEGRREKFMRWLGFVQGVLWANDLYTIEELKNHNRPKGDDQE